VHVFVDLLGGGVVVWPFLVGGEAEGVVVGWDVALATRISASNKLELNDVDVRKD
jgi:hypothetical protein